MDCIIDCTFPCTFNLAKEEPAKTTKQKSKQILKDYSHTEGVEFFSCLAYTSSYMLEWLKFSMGYRLNVSVP